MKKLHLVTLLSVLFTLSVFAQNSINKWAISVGAAATNHSFQGRGIFDNYFNTDNWSLSTPLANVKVNRYLMKGIVADLSVAAGNVELKDFGGNEVSTGADKLFINAGIGIQYHIVAALFNKEEARIDPYLRAGVTYNYFDWGTVANIYNAKNAPDNTETNWSNNNNAGPNFGAGINFWITRKVGIGLESNYNWIWTPQPFKHFNDSGDFWQHSASLIFKLGSSDRDKDGILDKDDVCPKVPGLEQFKGCPDTDTDGLQDSEDNCPTEAGPMENKGCPWGDKDQDMVTDNIDKCPEEKGELANKGCPWGDRDMDGVKDNVDKCPNEKGEVTNNGCPVRKVSYKEEAAQVTLALQNLLFDSGKTTIRPEGDAKLDAAATIIKSNTGKYLIGGHTDNSGPLALNNKLSKERAQAVVKALESRGVEAGRLVSEGFGPSKPIADNNTLEGKQANRRVEVTALTEEEYQKLTAPKPVVKKAPAKKKAAVKKK